MRLGPRLRHLRGARGRAGTVRKPGAQGGVEHRAFGNRIWAERIGEGMEFMPPAATAIRVSRAALTNPYTGGCRRDHDSIGSAEQTT